MIATSERDSCLLGALLLSLFTGACGSGIGDDVCGIATLGVAAPAGSHLPGVSDTAFEEGLAEFVKVRTVSEGLGPIYNASSCASCHNLGAAGGAGIDAAVRYGHFASDDTFIGGSLLHSESLGNFTARDGTRCSVPTEMLPADATVVTRRLPTQLFGLGLLVAMPDAFFYELAQSEPEAVRGQVNLVRISLPDVEDTSQEVGGRRVGRLTWKAATVGITQFSAAALLNEVGVSSQHCVHGKSVTTYASDLAPNATPVSPVQCQDGVPGTDFVSGNCDSNRTAIEPHVARLATYIKFLAPPPRPQFASSPSIEQGRRLFEDTGCADCHTSRAFTTPAEPFNGVPGNYTFYPYSDYLLHDVGELGDYVGQAGESRSKVHLMKTAPLWGVRLRPRLLHDGRALDVGSAIREHGGQGEAAAHAFERLSPCQQRTLVDFVFSL